MAKFRLADGTVVDGVAINEQNQERIQHRLSLGLGKQGKLPRIPADAEAAEVWLDAVTAGEALLKFGEKVLGKTNMANVSTMVASLEKGYEVFNKMVAAGLTIADLVPPAKEVSETSIADAAEVITDGSAE